jgi:hypothetical protein
MASLGTLLFGKCFWFKPVYEFGFEIAAATIAVVIWRRDAN